MFKKLKKKIEEETSGGVHSPGGARDLESHGPGLASPLRLDQGSSPNRKDFDTMSMSSGTSEPREATSKEDMARLLMKRNDQVRKLEGKITDLAALIKDRSRNVERLEGALERQSTESERRIQELNEQLSAARARQREAQANGSDEALQSQLEELKKYAASLEEKALMAEGLKERFYRQEEENDESLGLATQEAAKVKHLLLNTQEELVKVKGQLRETTELRNISARKVEELENEVQSLMQQIASLTTTNEEVSEDNERLRSAVEDVRSQKQGVERQLQGVQQQQAAKSRELTATQTQLADLQEAHRQLQQSSDAKTQQLSEQLSEKEEKICRLTEKVETLEQRLKDGELSGDERVTALEAQRSTLEEKLSEVRDQLSAFKASTAENTKRLEQQIATLDGELLEKKALLKETKEELDSLQYTSQQQLSELHHRLEEAQKKAKNNWDQLADRERQMEKQRIGFENELLKARERCSDMEAELKVKVTTLETEIRAMEKARKQDQKAAENSMQEEWLEKEIDLERRLSGLEGEVEKHKALLADKEGELAKLQHQLTLRDRHTAHTADRLKNMETESKSQKIIMEQHKADMLKATRECQAAVREREEAVAGRASMQKEMERLRARELETRRDTERELRQKETSIAGLERAVEELNSELTDAKQQLSSVLAEQKAAATEAESAQITQLRAEITQLETQLADKAKTVKTQNQRISDLKKTLQREFKVQALPNDEPPLPQPSLSKSSSTPQGLNTLPDNYSIHHSTHHARPSFTNSSGGKVVPSSLSQQQRQMELHLHNGADMAEEGGGGRPKKRGAGVNNHMEYNRDINFEYLRHVVLKFMLSRETEALHLIKAVSVLLDFTHDEQQMLKDTLQYKMSWFGFKSPSIGASGQMAKTIPPSY